MVRRHLNNRDVQRLLLGEHELEGHPDAVVDAALDALRLDAGLDQVLPDIGGELGRILVRPVVLVDEGLRVVEVADEVVLWGG